MDSRYRILWQPSHHHQSLVKKLPRPTLVFCKFRAVLSKVDFFQLVIALFVAFLFLILNGIVFGCRDRVFPVLFLFLILFFLFLANRLCWLMGARQSKGLTISWFCLFGPNFFCAKLLSTYFLGLYFSRSIIRLAITSRIIGVCFSNYDTRL